MTTEKPPDAEGKPNPRLASKVQAPTLQADEFADQRTALYRVLDSGCFAKAPALAAMITYICNAYFDGRTHEIKEYTLATEALGRDPNFDQRKDSIVRVEMHRLRKRLRQFYAEEGADFPLQIDIAVGQYAPVFKQSVIESSDVVVKPRYYGKTVIRRSRPNRRLENSGHERNSGNGEMAIVPLTSNAGWSLEEQETPQLPSPVVAWSPPTSGPNEAIPPAVRGSATASSSVWRWGLAACALIALFFGVRFALRVLPNEPNTGQLNTHGAPLTPRRTVRILAGRETHRYLDLTGRVWEGDQFFRGGRATAIRSDATVFGSDPNLFESRRQGEFSYAIPLMHGYYEARLWFAATDAPSRAPQSVWANGVPILENLDVAKDAGGPNITDIRVFTGLQPGADGFLRLRFGGDAFLNALEVFPTDGVKMAPLRIICQSKGHRTPDGQYWEPDQFYDGGSDVVRSLPVSWANDFDLLKGERYGDFRYSLPVGPGSYTVNLYFAETWFPQIADRPTHLGNRIFSVECDGVPLLTNFDPASMVHRNYRGFRLSFPHLRAPGGHGKLTLNFKSITNFANINAIEVLPE
jgi:Malectin domain